MNLLLLLIRRYLACRKPKLQGQVTTNVTVCQTSNDCVNKKVFKHCLKVATDDAVMTSVGRLFHTRRAAAPNDRMHSHRWFGVVCDAQPACELSLIVVICERCRHQPTASLSWGIQVRSGYGSGTQERPNGTECVQEHAASANRANC